VALTAPRLRTLDRGSRRVLDRLSAFLSEDIGSALKGGAKVCQHQLVNEVLRLLVTEFVINFGRKYADTYSARLPELPSLSHPGCQTHQTTVRSPTSRDKIHRDQDSSATEAATFCDGHHITESSLGWGSRFRE
jgi:hypothetical protein